MQKWIVLTDDLKFFHFNLLLIFFSGIAWSFRFSSQRKKKILIENETLNIHDWLQRLNLCEYEENFKCFESVEELLNYKEKDLKQLGIKNSSHSSRIIASLSALKGR